MSNLVTVEISMSDRDYTELRHTAYDRGFDGDVIRYLHHANEVLVLLEHVSDEGGEILVKNGDTISKLEL